MRLTKTVIDKARYEGESYVGKDGKPKFSRYVIWDEGLPGFGVRITPAGRKSFILSYRVGGRKKLMNLGTYGPLTLDQARKKARRELAGVIDGKDPLGTRQQEKRETAQAKTVGDLIELYLELHAAKKKPSSIRADKSLIYRHVLPAFGRLPVESLSQQDVARLHLAMRETPYQANRMLALVSKMMNLAEQWGLRPSGANPCRHIQRFKERKRERFLSADELRRLGEVLTATEQEGVEPPSAVLALRLLLLTGARRGEILTLRWDEVDFERACLRLPDSKTGQKVIPLGPAALELLVKAPRIEGNPYVCPGVRIGHHLVGLPRIWARVCERAGLEGVRIHDLRHSFAAVGAGGGLGLPIIGALLGHTVPQTTARYAHIGADPLQQAAARISDEIAAHLNGETGEVRALKPRK